MTVRVRAAMSALPSYVAGRKSPGAVVLASNESPFGLLPSVAEAINEMTSGVSRYPDMASTRLVEAIAVHHGVSPDRVAVGAGSVEVVGQIAAAVVEAGDEVIFGWRAFEAYPIITAVVGGVGIRVPLRDDVHDLDAMADAVTDKTRLVLVCNPNNPTATAVGTDALRGFLDRIPADVLVVIDEAYPIITTVVGGVGIKVPLRDDLHDLDAMADAVTDKTRLVLVCNPNNPTATAVGADALRSFLDRIPADVLVVIDEAYHHYADPEVVPDALALFGDRPNVVVTRTFSKAYALAGLRVGYCVGAPDVVAAVRKTQVPFSVSGLAQECAIAALGDSAEVERRAALTIEERERVVKALTAAGYDVPPSQANFVWLGFGDDAASFGAHCEAAGVLIRPFAGDGVRVTIGLPEENDAFLAVLSTWQKVR